MKFSIVGNGKLSKKYGKRIDSGTVVRFNRARVLDYEDIVGSKTDVLSLVGETGLSYNSAAGYINRDVLTDTGLVWFSAVKHNQDYEKLLDSISRQRKSYTYIGFEDYQRMAKEIDSDYVMARLPSTGVNTICYCYYQMDDKAKMNVYGFDCFETGHYFDDEKRNNEKFHDLSMEQKIIERLKADKRIKFFN